MVIAPIDGYLCPLVTKAGKSKADTSSLHVRGPEFVAGDPYERIVDCELGPLSEPVAAELLECYEEAVPF